MKLDVTTIKGKMTRKKHKYGAESNTLKTLDANTLPSFIQRATILILSGKIDMIPNTKHREATHESISKLIKQLFGLIKPNSIVGTCLIQSLFLGKGVSRYPA